MRNLVSSETCSQISSADSTYVRSGMKNEETELSTDEEVGMQMQDTESAKDSMSIMG